VSNKTETYVSRARHIELLKNKVALYRELEAQTPISDIENRISILDAVSNYEAEIEYLRESNQNIEEDMQYRNITVSINRSVQIEGEKDYWANTGQMIVDAFGNSLRVFLVLVIMLLPFVAAAGIVYVIVRVRKKSREQPKPGDQTQDS
jgi:hypothetical protein